MKKVLALSLVVLFVSTAIPVAGFAAEPKAFITPPAPIFSDAERQAELARRRAAVAAKMSDNSVLVMMSAEPKLYTNDVDYVFRQENNLYYLTNLKQKDATLVITKTGDSVTETIYIPRRIPQQETWNGHMYSVEEAKSISGIGNIQEGDKLASYLATLKDAKAANLKEVYLLLPTDEHDSDGMREFRQETDFSKSLSGYKVVNAQPIFAQLRLSKSPYEVKMLQHAVDISVEGHMRSWAIAPTVKMEYEVQAEFEYTLRRRNADYWGYPSIVGCGPNATTLHYEESQSPVKSGDLLLMDAAAEYDHMSADVTRTFPISGKFSKEQADIYQIVYDAQEAAAVLAKPGSTHDAMGDAADVVIKNGLAKLGLIESPDATFKIVGRNGKTADIPQYRIWYMHGLGHWIGMNVHDVGSYETKLGPGMTFTIEPGIYIREDALNYLADTPENKAFVAKVKPAWEKYKNIGVRIEDDILITPTGHEWMTGNLPRKLADVEAFMAANKNRLP